MKARGFTLIEMLVVMAVLAILASAALPLSEMVARRGKERELKAALTQVRDALDAYKRAYDAGRIASSPGASGYPPSLQTLVDGVPDAREAGQRLYFLRRVPRDPFADRTAQHAGSLTAPTDGWGLRSYASPPDRPKAGADVYDVYSLSKETGLNGIAYREW
jgi:general secretion pathway protein G